MNGVDCLSRGPEHESGWPSICGRPAGHSGMCEDPASEAKWQKPVLAEGEDEC